MKTPESLFVSRILYGGIFTLYAILTGNAVYTVIYKLSKLSPILYQVNDREGLPFSQMVLCFILPAIAVFGCLYHHIHKNRLNFETYILSMLPLTAYAVYFFLPNGYWSPFLFTLILGLTVYRICLIGTPEEDDSETPGNGYGKPLLILSVICLTFAGYGYYMQNTALNVMYLTYNNWGCYVNTAYNTYHGQWFMNDESGVNFLATHFSPATFLLLGPYVCLFPSVKAVFILNSCLLYSMPVFLFWFAYKMKLSPKTAFILGFAMVFSPSLANMNLSLFYGFHSIFLFLPFLMMFFIFFESKKYYLAFALFGLSLFIKETIPVFWFGIGIVFFLKGHKKSGIWISLVSIVYWIIVIKVVQPWISGDNVYDYSNRYMQLGGSLTEIALSPIMNPQAFWSSLFRPSSIFFILSLLLPVFYLTLSRPLLLLGASFTIVFICLQAISQFVTICLHYQAETVVLIFINAVFAAQALKERRDSLWFSGLQSGLKEHFSSGKKLSAVLNATVVTAVLCWYFLGQSAIGKYSFKFIEDMPDMTAEMEQIKKIIPPEVPMNATMHTAAHFLLRNKVSPWMTPIYGNYFVMDLRHGYHHADDLDRTRAELLGTGRWKPVYAKPVNVRHFVVFKEYDQPVEQPKLPVLTDKQWAGCGAPLPVDLKDFSARCRIISQNRRTFVRIAVRVNKPVAYDVNMEIIMFNGRDKSDLWDVFGRGIVPAFNCIPGSVYIMDYPLPENWQSCRAVALKLSARPAVVKVTPGNYK